MRFGPPRIPRQPAGPPEPEPAEAQKAAPEPAGTEPADTIADLIARAVASEVPRLVHAADRIQDLVDRLEGDLNAHERSAELRAELARIEARAAEIKGQLTGKRPAATPGPAADDSEVKAIRAWAKANGIACSDRGRIPQGVLAAYRNRRIS